MQNRLIPATERKAITKLLESIIKKHGFDKSKSVVNHYFKNSKERQKTLARINELKKELESLEKKK